MTRLGHQRRPDGTLLRLDIELGRYVGSHYDAELHLIHQVTSTDIGAVTREMENWK